MPKRIRYQNWIVRMGHDPADQAAVDIPPPAERLFESGGLGGLIDRSEVDNMDDRRRDRTIKAVREGMECLDEQEREFIHLYYFLGQSYRTISESSGRAVHRLEALHRRAVRRLKSILAEYVKNEFGVRQEIERGCPICSSDNLGQINSLLDAKSERETWSQTIRLLRSRFGIEIRTPQVLIGHQKFHRKAEEQ